MKKIILTLAAAGMVSGASAQEKGRFEVHDLGSFKLHVYYTNDALGDASYIVEGRNALVTMEQPLFKDNVAEFDAYLAKLNKPAEQRITDYHVGGTAHHDVVMPEGMPEFTKGAVYGGMMQSFAQTFGDALTAMPTGKISRWRSARPKPMRAFLSSSGTELRLISRSKHSDRQESILHSLDTCKGARQPPASIVACRRRRRDCRERKGIEVGSYALYRRTWRSCKSRCRTIQNRLPECDEEVAGGKQNT